MLSDPIHIKTGSRASQLALAQVKEVEALMRAKGIPAVFECREYTTRGDRDKTTSLTANAGDDFFTDTLDDALLSGEIEIAIHSAKDLPQQMREGLTIFALTKSPDETDAFIGTTPFDRLPASARVATSSPLRQEQVKRLRPDLKTVDIRGTIPERVQKMKDGYCEGIIVATVALKRLGLENLIQNIMPWEATALQGQLAVAGRTSDTRLHALFAAIDVRTGYGHVTLVGAGPGDPQLITVKGVRALESADCVFYDYLIPKELLNYAPRAEKIYAGKRKGAHAMPQDELNRLLRQKAVAGKNVVRLKGGDPLIFGRGADEIDYLRQYHIQIEVIPGVSSATGIPSQLGIPLTAREISSSVAFVSGYRQEEEDNNPNLLNIPQADTLVFLMGLTKLEKIVRSLKAAGWASETPIMVVSKGTCPEEKIVQASLANVEEKVAQTRLEPPVLILVGKTLQFYRPAVAPRVLYTGTDSKQFRARGAVFPFPMIEITPAKLSPVQTKTLLTNLASYDIILFTSKFGVRYFFELLAKEGYPLTGLETKTFVVIGKATAQELVEHRVHNPLVARAQTSEGLLREMTEKLELRGKKILFPRSALPNPYLKEKLTKLGAKVDELTIYENVPPAQRPLPAKEENIDQVVFTSPSTVRNFLAAYGAVPQRWKILSRGPVTSTSLREAGYTNFQEMDPADKGNEA